ncbi:MAG: fasciclin domain-containing protein [Phycisphaerales bacterium]|nr:fasciclin domain-containing protein [Phycisphaerales bacterium]
MLAAAACCVTAAVAHGQCGSGTKSAGGQHDIVETAVAAGQFKTLVAAVQAAGLVDVLKSDGPFTVFAPTDEAFARLPEGALDGLLKNPDALRSVLLYHVVPGKVMAADVVKLTTAKTALGQSVTIDAANGVHVDNAAVVKADVPASNGVIHVIDAVILPKNDIIEAARAAGSFKTLLKAIEAAGLADTLRGEGPFTVFAPTDEAFAKLGAPTIAALLQDKAKLAAILTYHVVPGRVMAADVVKLTEAKTVQGQHITIDATDGVMVDNAKVIKADVPATNGVIHVIDTVIIPE